MNADSAAENGTKSGVRASNTEREAFAHTVSIASRDGRLTVTEADERVAEIYAATFREELPTIVADLPRDTWPADFTGPRTETRSGAEAVHSTQWNGALITHAVIAGVFAIGAIAAWRHSGVPFFWPAWPLGWLGVSLLVHYRIRRRRLAN